MCKTVDELSDKLDDIIKEIIEENKDYSLKDIYSTLEESGITNRRYEPGISVKDYLDILASYGIINIKNGYYSPPKKRNNDFLEFAL